MAVVAAVIFAGLTRRVLTAALVGGSLLQVFVIVSGTIVPVMYFLGAIFAALWIIGILLGRCSTARRSLTPAPPACLRASGSPGLDTCRPSGGLTPGHAGCYCQ